MPQYMVLDDEIMKPSRSLSISLKRKQNKTEHLDPKDSGKAQKVSDTGNFDSTNES